MFRIIRDTRHKEDKVDCDLGPLEKDSWVLIKKDEYEDTDVHIDR